MRDAIVNDRQIPASKDAPPAATCPACGSEVQRRKRRNGNQTTYFWRHKAGQGAGCPRRYSPNGD
ncbi:MAG: hypothetical protein GY832_24630 [Chloroflexi bacterium]|nr:hypothetical protein [Chloroflexota bacterium]